MGPAGYTELNRRWLRMADGGFVDEFFAADYAVHLSGRIHVDLAELRRLERGFAAAFAGVSRSIEELWGAGDKAVLRVTTRARHTADFNGVPATGRAVVFAGIVVDRFSDRRIAESRGEPDVAGLWRQLNAVVPAAGGSVAPA
jgi:predicted ester cyclase